MNAQPPEDVSSLFQYLRAGVIVHAPDTRILFANEHAGQLLGLPVEQMSGKTATDPVWRFVREDETPLPPDEYPVSRVRATGQPVQDLVLGINRAVTGDRVWALTNAFPELSATGELRRIVVTFMDITVRKRTEAALRESEARYRLVSEHSSDVIWLFDLAANRFSYVSPAVERLRGYTVEEVMQQTMQDALTPESYRVVVDFLPPRLAAFAAGDDSVRSQAHEMMQTRKDGSVVATEVVTTLIADADRRVTHIQGVSRDITQRRQAEEESRSARAFLEMAIDMSPFAMWISDQEGALTRVNRALCDAIGLTQDQIVSRYNVLGDRNLEAQGVMPRVRAVFEKHEPARFSIPWLAAEAGSADLGGGRDMYIDVSMFPILNTQGELTNVVCQWVDITARKRAEEALRESEGRFRALVDGAPEGIFVQSEGCFVFLNPAMARLLGATRAEELLGTEIMARVAPEYHEAVRARIQSQRETGMPAPSMDQEYLRLDGSRVPVETTAVAFRFQGHDGHLVFVRDITTRRKAEGERESLQAQLQQAQKMESVGRLAGGVAHDFNNILMVQRGYCEMMKLELREGDPLAEGLAQIDACAERATALTRQLLAFSRRQTLQPKHLDLNALVKNLESMLRRLIGEDVELVMIPAPAPATVRADPGQIEQVIVNLAVNARDAMPQGGRLAIELSRVALDKAYAGGHVDVAPGPYVMLAVSDTGCGMDKETLGRIFEPFFTTKGEGKGTGLGLSTVYGIVHQSGGSIWVYSEPGKGSTFKVYLPRVEVEPAPLVSSEAKVTRGAGELVLVVEDEPALRGLALRIIEKLGYRALAAENGGAALILVEEQGLRPDLLITDVVMPGMSGRVLVERLRRARPDLKVIYMSGYTDDAIMHHGLLDAGINFLQKPFSMADLAAKIRSALGRE